MAATVVVVVVVEVEGLMVNVCNENDFVVGTCFCEYFYLWYTCEQFR